MLILRFQRQGKKKDFIFRIVAVDSKIAVNSGKATEILGWLDPKTNKFELKKDRILYWLNQGAQVSDSCYNLLVKAKIIEGKKRPIKITKKKVKKGESTEGAEQQVEKEQSVKDKPAEEIKEDKKEEPMEEKKPEPESEAEKEQAQESQPEIKGEKQETPVEELKEEPKEKVDDKKKEEVEVKEEVKEEPKIEQVKEEVKEGSKKDKKEEVEEKPDAEKSEKSEK